MITAKPSTTSLPSAKADAVVVAVAQHGDDVLVHADPAVLPAEARAALDKTLRTVRATAGPGDITRLPAPAPITAPLVIAVGLGPERTDIGEHERLRRAAGAAARNARSLAKVAYAMPAAGPEEAAAIAEGALLGAYSYDEFRTAEKPATTGTALILLPGPLDRATRDAVSRGAALARSVAGVRDLVNAPPGHLRPSDFAARAEQLADDAGLGCKVLDPRQLKRGKYGGILGVGQGSSDGPRLVQLTYRHPKAKAHLALVGKGITFDSGGLSIKPAKAMETMKSDMAGAAAVAGALQAVARLKPKVDVTGWLALAENMPSGTAQRPGDIIAMYGGKTVEVLNTDAEGRLVMADALVRAAEDDPDVIIDIATLTGAQLVALGPLVAGAMANHDGLRAAVVAAGSAAGESLWEMPLPPELRPSLDSPVADIANIGDRNGGMLTAGLFLQEFVDAELPWAHLDIAGPAFNTAAPHGYTPKGGTGFGVATLVTIAERLAAGELID